MHKWLIWESPLVVGQRALALRLCVQHIAVLHRQPNVNLPFAEHIMLGTGPLLEYKV